MSENDATMDEKYFDLQYKLIDTKLVSISNSLDKFGQDVKKILDDHEQRLREQAKADAAQVQEIVALRLELKDLRQDQILHRTQTQKCLDDITKEHKESVKRELTFWQTLAMDAVKYIAVGAGGGGAVVAVFKLFGVNL